MGRIPLLVDSDTAGDDTVALLLALLSPQVDLKAITICAGNVAFDQQVENALYTVEVAGRAGQVPVHPGCRDPLLRPWASVTHIHGEDGMGNTFFPAAQQRPEREHGAQTIVRLADEHAGELVIVGIAPLTNLALACRLDPELPENVKRVYLMAGANHAVGNVTPVAEYNVWADPEAAEIVFQAGFDLTMVGWDVCVRHSVLSDEHWDHIASLETPLAEFFRQVNQVTRDFGKRAQRLAGSTHPDALTVAGLIDPDVFPRTERRFVTVETQSDLTRGQTVVDNIGVLERTPNADVVDDADETRFRSLLFDILSQSVP